MAETRGWCPDLFTPMQSGDGWLLRVKPLLARITAQQAREIAAAAGFGNGLLELTSRANLQLRGLTPEGAHRAASDLVAWGLADPDPVRERRRNLLLSPLMPPSALAVAAALTAALCAASWLDALPAKFGFGVSAGQFLLAAAQCDLLVQAQDDHWRLSLGGIDAGCDQRYRAHGCPEDAAGPAGDTGKATRYGPRPSRGRLASRGRGVRVRAAIRPARR